MTYTEHFTPEEFRDWADDMSPRLVTMIDVLRHMIGSAIVISPHPDSLGRELGRNSESAHNIDRWGEVLAADWFIPHVTTRVAVEGVADRVLAQIAYDSLNNGGLMMVVNDNPQAAIEQMGLEAIMQEPV